MALLRILIVTPVIGQTFTYFIGITAFLIDYTVHAILPLLETADFNRGKGKSSDRSNSLESQSVIPVQFPRSWVTLCQC